MFGKSVQKPVCCQCRPGLFLGAAQVTLCPLMLKGGRSIAQSKQHYFELPQIVASFESCFLCIWAPFPLANNSSLNPGLKPLHTSKTIQCHLSLAGDRNLSLLHHLVFCGQHKTSTFHPSFSQEQWLCFLYFPIEMEVILVADRSAQLEMW